MRGTAFLAVVLSFAISAGAQTNVGLALDEVTDNRVAMGDLTGFLSLRVKLTGSGLDKALAARVIVKEAKDDRGTSLTDGSDKPDFFAREYNNGTLNFQVKQPARAASSVRLKGTIELYVPARDPAAIVKVSKALSKLDTPLTAAGLKTAKLTITPLSVKGYSAQLDSHKLDDKKIAELRAEGKKRGVPDDEIEKMIGLAKAMEGLNEQPQEGMVILSGTKADFDRIYRVEILGDDGKPIDVGSRSTSTRGDDATLMTMQPQKPPPANAALEFFVLTDKSRLSFPFDLKVTLP
ncbi:MAG: hypothetical protein DMF56_20770 [Acidobacteria bacterium]|nr:MAG: hypothetical protein DMF56_20770 [Acidobacteriota bacterium]